MSRDIGGMITPCSPCSAAPTEIAIQLRIKAGDAAPHLFPWRRLDTMTWRRGISPKFTDLKQTCTARRLSELLSEPGGSRVAEKRAEAAERDISHFLSFPSLFLSSAEDTRSGDVLQTGGGLQETSREFETAGSGREGERNGRFKWGGREGGSCSFLSSFLYPSLLPLSWAPLSGAESGRSEKNHSRNASSLSLSPARASV